MKCTADGFVNADGRPAARLTTYELLYRAAETLGHLPDRVAAEIAGELRLRAERMNVGCVLDVVHLFVDPLPMPGERR